MVLPHRPDSAPNGEYGTGLIADGVPPFVIASPAIIRAPLRPG
jgi:hypothetical protein